MQCPHCLCEFDAKPHVFALGQDPDGTWQVSSIRCPTCDRLIVDFCTAEGQVYPGRPALFNRPRLSEDVPSDLAAEYHTAATVIPYSPEASAAISRRLLHAFLAEYVGAGEGTLAEQIATARTSCALPPYLRDSLDTLTRVARLDANEAKSTHPEALVPTEPGEPEWLLDVLDQFFDLYFVQPARMQRKRARLEERVGPLVAIPEAEPQTLGEPEAESGESAEPAEGEEPGAHEAADGAAADGAAAAEDATAEDRQADSRPAEGQTKEDQRTANTEETEAHAPGEVSGEAPVSQPEGESSAGQPKPDSSERSWLRFKGR